MNSVTLQLPESSYKRAQRAAMLLNRSIEDLLESMLNAALPALDDAPRKLETEMAQLSTLLERLHHQAGRLLVIKSQAYALLHLRGYAVPQP